MVTAHAKDHGADMTRWQEMCQRLALERQTGMPRWRPGPTRTPIPDVPASVWDDSPTQIAARRAVLEETMPDQPTLRIVS